MCVRKILAGFPAAALVMLAATAALAAQPMPWQINFQPAASPVMAEIEEFNVLLSIIIVGISVFVLGLLAFICIRFSAGRNPTPSKTAHNTVLEVIWTVVPVMILVVIAVPSFRLLTFASTTPEAEMTLKATGHQWYWSYAYPDHGDFTFDSLLIEDQDLKSGQLRLLETDNRVILPVDTTIRIQVTADDVLHSWAVPAFGVKIDAVPGRLNETWTRIDKEGVYYGQCSELCGVRHGFMPITVEAVSKEAFARWVEEAKKTFAGGDGGDGGVRLSRVEHKF